MTAQIFVGDCREVLRRQPSKSVHMCVTSPPYWGLRDYGIEPGVWGGDVNCDHTFVDETIERELRLGLGLQELGKRYSGGGKKAATVEKMKITRGFCMHCNAWRGAFGLEPDPDLFIDHLVEVFDEVWRVLRDDGALWLNLGDSYAGSGRGGNPGEDTSTLEGSLASQNQSKFSCTKIPRGPKVIGQTWRDAVVPKRNNWSALGLKGKDLVGVPWMAAFALRKRGWYLRSDTIWHKPNPMPESTTDRPTKAHEYLFLLTKSARYFYDAEAIKEPSIYADSGIASAHRYELDAAGPRKRDGEDGSAPSFRAITATRNKRSVWTVATQPFAQAHFATFPPDLIEPCILAGTSMRGCCPACGTGWERVTIDEPTGKMQKMPDGMATYAGGHSAIHKDGREKGESGNPVMASVTIGFYPACSCAKAPALPPYPAKPSRAAIGNETRYKLAMDQWRFACEAVDITRKRLCDAQRLTKTVPAVVLDPFGGAGTTGLVAERLQRDSLLAERNETYAAMAARRITDEGGMLARVTTIKIVDKVAAINVAGDKPHDAAGDADAAPTSARACETAIAPAAHPD